MQAIEIDCTIMEICLEEIESLMLISAIKQVHLTKLAKEKIGIILMVQRVDLHKKLVQQSKVKALNLPTARILITVRLWLRYLLFMQKDLDQFLINLAKQIMELKPITYTDQLLQEQIKTT